MIQCCPPIGCNRVDRLMDRTEKAGIVGVAKSSKPHEVLISDEVDLGNMLIILYG